MDYIGRMRRMAAVIDSKKSERDDIIKKIRESIRGSFGWDWEKTFTIDGDRLVVKSVLDAKAKIADMDKTKGDLFAKEMEKYDNLVSTISNTIRVIGKDVISLVEGNKMAEAKEKLKTAVDLEKIYSDDRGKSVWGKPLELVNMIGDQEDGSV